MESATVTSMVLKAIAELNQQRQADQRLPLSDDTALSGEGGRLDSLGLVNLVVLVEQYVEDSFGCHVGLTDGEAVSGDESPFHTVASLSRHITMLLERKGVKNVRA